MSRNIVLVGFQGSGKTSAAQALVDDGWHPLSFADSLKDAVAAIFCWPREMVEGTTPESRNWRNTVDPFWADRLGIPDFTCRTAMQNFGTDIMRKHVSSSIWVDNSQYRAEQLPEGSRVVFIDGRFADEVEMVRERLSGYSIRIKRGPDPDWLPIAKMACLGDAAAIEKMQQTGIHRSEWDWVNAPIDLTIENDSDLPTLQARLREAVGRL